MTPGCAGSQDAGHLRRSRGAGVDSRCGCRQQMVSMDTKGARNQQGGHIFNGKNRTEAELQKPQALRASDCALSVHR